jgi:hypothetical protein
VDKNHSVRRIFFCIHIFCICWAFLLRTQVYCADKVYPSKYQYKYQGNNYRGLTLYALKTDVDVQTARLYNTKRKLTVRAASFHDKFLFFEFSLHLTPRRVFIMDNYNSKSVPSARQQIKLIQEKQKLLTIAIQAAGCPIGIKTVTELIQQSTLSLRQLIKLIEEKQKLLTIAMQAAGGSIGIEAVRQIMQLGSFNNFADIQAFPTPEKILEEIKASEVELTPGLVSLVKNSPYQNVRNSITIFKTYPKNEVRNPAGLLYTIILNENRRAS